jgi:hypothetical protein
MVLAAANKRSTINAIHEWCARPRFDALQQAK